MTLNETKAASYCSPSGIGDLKAPDGSTEKVSFHLILNSSDFKGGGFIFGFENNSDVPCMSKLLLRVGFAECLGIVVGRTVGNMLPCQVLGRVDISVWHRGQEARPSGKHP